MSDFAERYDEASEEVLAELKKTLESIDPASLERLAQEILKADQVFFVGVECGLLGFFEVGGFFGGGCPRLAVMGFEVFEEFSLVGLGFFVEVLKGLNGLVIGASTIFSSFTYELFIYYEPP